MRDERKERKREGVNFFFVFIKKIIKTWFSIKLATFTIRKTKLPFFR